MHHHLVPGPDVRGWDQHLLIPCLQPHLPDVQGHTPGQVPHRLFVGPLLQYLAHAQQIHDRARRVKVRPQDGDCDGRCVQHLHLQPSPGEAFQSPCHVPDGFVARVGGPHREGEKLFPEMEQCPADQLLTIHPVQLPPGIFQHLLRHLYLLVSEAPQSLENVLSVPAVADHGVPCLLVDLCRVHAGKHLQKVEQRVCLPAGHPLLLHMQADAPSYLMSDPVFQL